MMTDFAATQILLTAAEFFAASSLIVAIAWLASYRRSASARHLVWTMALASLLVLPVLAAVVPGVISISYPPPVVETVQAVPMSAVAMIPAPVPPSAHMFELHASDIAMMIMALWALGFVLIALRSGLSAIVLHFLKRKSVEAPFESDELPELSVPVRYRLRISEGEHGPLTWGVVNPVVLLPNKSLYWPAERLQAVLKHELAHVARRDGLTQTMALVVVALYWMNPLVWLAARALRREAEMAADDAVLVSGVTPSEYAGELLEVAREFQTRAFSPAMPLYMAAPSALEDRVKSVLAPTKHRSGVSSMDVLKGFAAALLATSALAIARPSLAEEAPPPAPAQTVETTQLADVQTAPAAPVDVDAPEAAPETPATPDTPDVAPVPPVPPAAVVEVNPPVRSGHHHTHVVRSWTENGHRHVHVEVDGKVEDFDYDMTKIQPEIDRAMAEAHRAMADAKRQQAIARKAMDEARPQIAAALAEAKRAMAQIDVAKIQAEVNRAMAKAQRDMNRGKGRFIIEQHADNDDAVTDDSGDDQNDDANDDSGDDNNENN